MSVIRIEYNQSASAFNLDDVGYLHYLEYWKHGNQIAKFEIHLIRETPSVICLEEHNNSKLSDLKKLYMDTFTKWKNHVEKMNKQNEQLAMLVESPY